MLFPIKQKHFSHHQHDPIYVETDSATEQAATHPTTVVADDREWIEQSNEDWEEDWLPAADSTDLDLWEQIVESLADNILWDRDFELEAILIDQSPDRSALMKQYLGIDDELENRSADRFQFSGIAQSDRDVVLVEIPAASSRRIKTDVG